MVVIDSAGRVLELAQMLEQLWQEYVVLGIVFFNSNVAVTHLVSWATTL